MQSDEHSLILNAEYLKTEGPRTYVIFGLPRGGTTMVAGICRILGLHIGDQLAENCEDPDFNFDLLRKKEENEIDALVASVSARNAAHTVWGWKYPNAAHYLPDLLPHLHNPHLICIFRDALSAARRQIVNRGMDPIEAMGAANRRSAKNVSFIGASEAPSLLLSYERALSRPAKFTQEIATFLGCDDEAANEAAEEYIASQGGYSGVPPLIGTLR